jgi:hypothetical protein
MLFRERVAVYCENHTEHTNTVPTSHGTHNVSATETNRLMLFMEIVAVYCENHTEHIITLCGQNVEILNVKGSGSQFLCHKGFKCESWYTCCFYVLHYWCQFYFWVVTRGCTYETSAASPTSIHTAQRPKNWRSTHWRASQGPTTFFADNRQLITEAAHYLLLLCAAVQTRVV